MPTTKQKQKKANTMTGGGKSATAKGTKGMYLPHKRPKSSGVMTSSSGKVVYARPKAKEGKAMRAVKKAWAAVWK